MIRNKLIVVYLVPTVALVLLVGLLVYVEAERSLDDALGHRLTAIAQTTVGTLPASDPRRIAELKPDDDATLDRLRTRLEAARTATGARRVFIFTRAGDGRFHSLVDTRPDVRFNDVLYELDADAVEMERVFRPPGEPTSSVLYASADGVQYKNGYAPLLHEGAVVGAVGVEGSAEYFEVLSDFRNVMLAFAILAIGVIVAVSLLVARSMTRPIDVLVEASRRFGRGDLSLDVALDRKDEFQTLALAFNEMRKDLLDRDQQMQMMLSGIAHEVRNPLGGMELFSGLLAEEVEPGSPQAGYVDRIRKELSYLGRVVNDFLDFARRKPLQWDRMTAKSLLDEVVGLLTWDLESEEVKLVCGDVEGELELTCDRERVHPVLINLVRNAGAASAPGTTVRLDARVLDRPALDGLPELAAYHAHTVVLPPDPDASDRWVLVTVADQGEGIGAADLETVFKPFYTTREKGSGLGLALTQKCIAEHGGGFVVASTPRDNPEGAPSGTLMAIAMPFKPDVERAKMDVPDGWLG